MANLNTESSLMELPEVNLPRYLHRYTIRRHTTSNVGDIQTIYINTLIMPGETVRMSLRQFWKMTTSLFPSMDTLHADIYAFADNYVNLWDHAKEFFGEDLDNPQEVAPEYTIPEIVIQPTDTIEPDDLLNFIAVPYMTADPTRNNITIDRLGYNHYCNMYNWFFRDQNYIAKIPFSKGDESINKSDLKVQKCLKAARNHDYFMGTPAPQKGAPETIPLATEIPVIGNGQALTLICGNTPEHEAFSISGYSVYANKGTAITRTPTLNTAQNVGDQRNEVFMTGNRILGLNTTIGQSGVIADATNALAATLNALRISIVRQQLKEQLLFYGGRINEVIRSQYGVTPPEGIIQQTELLGAKRIDLNMDTVLQTSETSGNSPLGDSAGYSTTFDEDFLFEKSFTFWSVLSVVAVVRQEHSYAQGLAQQHMKRRKYDFYNPAFEGLGMQPRKKAEIYLTGHDTDNDIWNFAPAWQEYRFEVGRSTGYMAPQVPNSLAYYTYTDHYDTVPNSGEEWINETPIYVDRTLVVSSEKAPQFICDFAFDIDRINLVPNFVLPGIDKI